MKNFIKDWWPLLVIVAIVLWKRHEKKNRCYNHSHPPMGLAPIPTEQRFIHAGFEEMGTLCPECGSAMYAKLTESPNDLINGTESAFLMQSCTNPNCPNCHLEYLPK